MVSVSGDELLHCTTGAGTICSSCAHLVRSLLIPVLNRSSPSAGVSEDARFLAPLCMTSPGQTSSAHMAPHACIFACSSTASFLMTCMLVKSLGMGFVSQAHMHTHRQGCVARHAAPSLASWFSDHVAL